jgi:SAM-dependent methyltransferase
MAEFDEFAPKYQQIMERSCALSGESPDFYAAERIRWLKRRLRKMLPIDTVLHFGCGTGGSINYFFDILDCKQVIGIDPSAESLRVARKRYPAGALRLCTVEELTPSGDIPFAFCNGVFHHIRPADRLDMLKYIRSCLTQDGVLAFWENNPWNPIVVYGMSLNEFDRNAQMLSARAAIHLLKKSGFGVESTDFCFFFPRFAQSLRGCERALKWLPIGAQYLIVADASSDHFSLLRGSNCINRAPTCPCPQVRISSGK